MRRAAAALLAALVVLAGCGGDGVDPETARVRAADAELAKRPDDPRAQAHLIDVAFTAAQRTTDPAAGTYTEDAVKFLKRAAEVWPRYVASTRRSPDPRIAGQMAVAFA